MWICQKCNTQNTANFCLNCGAAVNAQALSDLPPTVLGAMPFLPPNQAQSQPSFQAQIPAQFIPPQSASFPAAPKKSNFTAILLIGGVGGLVVVSAIGLLLYIKVVGPYLSNQRLEKREQENQSKANAFSANALLPESVTRNSQTFKRSQTMDKIQLLQMSKDLPPGMKSEIKDISDAAAGGYTNAANQKIGLQIFKYNSSGLAKSSCQKIAQELIKNKNNLASEPKNYYLDDRPTYCEVSAELKNGEYVVAASLYGFLYISVGNKDYAPELGLTVWRKLIEAV